MKICAVIPAFNNGTTISEVVEKARCEIDHVVVLDDGSTDRISIIFLMNLFWKNR
jgi:glycosyltransferase involved in cell wall biosynthesis